MSCSPLPGLRRASSPPSCFALRWACPAKLEERSRTANRILQGILWAYAVRHAAHHTVRPSYAKASEGILSAILLRAEGWACPAKLEERSRMAERMGFEPT